VDGDCAKAAYWIEIKRRIEKENFIFQGLMALKIKNYERG